MIAAAGLCQYWIPVSGASRLSPVPNVVQLSVFGSVSFAFQSGCWAGVVRFSLVGDRSFVPAATWGWAMVVRVSVGFVGLVSFVFHYWWDRLFVSAATWGFCHNLSLDLR